MLISKTVKSFLPLLLVSCLVGTSSAKSLPEGNTNKVDQRGADKQNKFNFEEHQTAESAEAVLSAMFPAGAEAAKLVEVLTQAGARCVKEPIASHLVPGQREYFEKNNPELLLNTKMVECRYSRFVGASVATEWTVITAEYPDGRIKVLKVSHFLTGP